MTLEERAEALLLSCGSAQHRSLAAYALDGSEDHMRALATQVKTAIIEAIMDAVSDERARWQEATRHDGRCEYVLGPKLRCSCGAHDALAELHREAAAAVRATA